MACCGRANSPPLSQTNPLTAPAPKHPALCNYVAQMGYRLPVRVELHGTKLSVFLNTADTSLSLQQVLVRCPSAAAVRVAIQCIETAKKLQIPADKALTLQALLAFYR